MSGGPSSVIPVEILPQNSSSPGDPFLHRFPEYKQEEQNMTHPLKSLLKLNLFALVAITAAVTPQALKADDQFPQILMNPNVFARNGVQFQQRFQRVCHVLF